MKVSPPTTYVIGGFSDHPPRLASYATKISQSGRLPHFCATLSDAISMNPGDQDSLVFVDETAICSANDVAKVDEMPASWRDKIGVSQKLIDKAAVRQLLLGSSPVEYFIGDELRMQSGLFKGGQKLICKPRWGTNSKSVQIVSSDVELEEAISEVDIDLNRVLLEEYIVGSHFAFDFNWDGSTIHPLGFAQKVMAKTARQISLGFDATTEMDPKIEHETVDLCQKFCSAAAPNIRLTFHGEFIQSSVTGRVFVAELNPRGPGGWLPELFSVSACIDFDRNVIENQLASNATVDVRDFHVPAVLGAVYDQNFFHQYEETAKYGNVLFVEPFYESFGDQAIRATKVGRWLLWGSDRDSVRKQAQDLFELSAPDGLSSETRASTFDIWKSRCC